MYPPRTFQYSENLLLDASGWNYVHTRMSIHYRNYLVATTPLSKPQRFTTPILSSSTRPPHRAIIIHHPIPGDLTKTGVRDRQRCHHTIYLEGHRDHAQPLILLSYRQLLL
ncbi:hypothetical protein ABKN59_008741 [Abortiporus biennis]